jgi:hypothetical protein
MKTTCALLLATFLPVCLFASDDLAKQRAKELVNQNNVRQGIAAPTQAPKPVATPQVVNPAAARQQQAVAKLRADIAAIKTGSAVTAQQKQQLANDLIAVADGPNKPSAASATKWAEDVSAACSEMALSDTSRGRFVQEIDAVLNPSKYPSAKMDAIFTDVQAIFQADGTKRKNAVQISEDVKALASDCKAK